LQPDRPVPPATVRGQGPAVFIIETLQKPKKLSKHPTGRRNKRKERGDSTAHLITSRDPIPQIAQ
jgi:hypothetical protein